MRDNSIVFAGLMPHAPILVPGVRGERGAEARRTVSAMEALARHVVSASPDTVVLISPHSPRQAGSFGLWRTLRLRGSLEPFGSPEECVDLPVDRTFADRLEGEVSRRGFGTWPITEGSLDHGATVPLSHLASAGWKGRTVVLSLNQPGEGGLDELGEAIAATAKALHRRVAVIASGDMSHRLTLASPNGFHPDAGRFDTAFIQLLEREAPVDFRRIDPNLQRAAAEDVVDSTWVALAATGFSRIGHHVLSYEGPFGVGYGVAILFEPKEPVIHAGPAKEAHTLSSMGYLPRVARRALAAHFENGPEAPPYHAEGELKEQCGVYVTIKTAEGELRGCRGTPAATAPNLIWETWHNARSAAFFDRRFDPVSPGELAHLRFCVTVLDRLEPVSSPAGLDPARYGILIAAADGRTGLLLPAIEGIDTIGQQLEIARRKAGISPDEPIEIRRFTARSFEE